MDSLMSATCPNCNKVLSYNDLLPQIDNMRQSKLGYLELEDSCPKCAKAIVLEMVGLKFSVKKADGNFAIISNT